MTRKPSNSSFFSVLYPDVFFGKIHWAPSEILEVKRPFLRSWRPNFGFHLFSMGFHLEFLFFWVSRSFDLSDLGDLRRGSGIFFQKLHFWNQCIPTKMRYVTVSWSKFSLNLSKTEVMLKCMTRSQLGRTKSFWSRVFSHLWLKTKIFKQFNLLKSR